MLTYQLLIFIKTKIITNHKVDKNKKSNDQVIQKKEFNKSTVLKYHKKKKKT